MPAQTSCNKYTDQTALRNKIVIRFYFFSRMFGRLQLFAYLCTRKTKPSVGALVQLVRIHACHAWGHGFESRTHRQKKPKRLLFLCVTLSPATRGQGCSPTKGLTKLRSRVPYAPQEEAQKASFFVSWQLYFIKKYRLSRFICYS